MATEPQLRTGDEIAGYTLESLVGRGGMGEVFRAVDGHLARAVALKVLAPGLVHDEASRDRIANVLRDLGLPTGPATVRA